MQNFLGGDGDDGLLPEFGSDDDFDGYVFGERHVMIAFVTLHFVCGIINTYNLENSCVVRTRD